MKYDVGAIFMIPLPSGKFAYAKAHRGHVFGVYNYISAEPSSFEEVRHHGIAFFQGCTDEAVKDGSWPLLGGEPFPDEAASWPPARAMGIVPGLRINPGLIQIVERGNIRRATLEEVKGMDIASFCHTPELMIETIVDRLVHGREELHRVPS